MTGTTILRVVLRPPMLLNHDDLEYKIEHDVPAWHNHLIYLLALFKIVTVSLDCTGSTATVQVTGGRLPYQYSSDNGATFSAPTTNTTYLFTGLSGGIYNILAKDSIGNIYIWEQIICNNYIVTFEPVYLTNYSTGYITDEASVQHTTAFTVSGEKNTLYSVTETTTNGTSFIGWSLTKPDRYTYTDAFLIGTDPLFQHLFYSPKTTIYALFLIDGPVVLEFCYYVTLSGYIATDIDKQYYCSTCDIRTMVYFNKNDYKTYGIGLITWYSDINLTTPVEDGYYKIYYINPPLIPPVNPPLYRLISGIPALDGYCCGQVISCV